MTNLQTNNKLPFIFYIILINMFKQANNYQTKSRTNLLTYYIEIILINNIQI